jgi:hypothetical protein
MGQRIPVVFLPVEVLMLDLPARASDAHDLGTILASDLKVGTPGIMRERLA